MIYKYKLYINFIIYNLYMSSPNIILSITSFFIITIIFYIYKFITILIHFNNDNTNGSVNLPSYLYSFLSETNYYSNIDIMFFILAIMSVILSQFISTLYNSKSLCGSVQYSYSLFNTSLCWGLFLLIFLIANKLWLKPFSNTFGYLFLSFFMGLSDKIKTIFGTSIAEQFIGKEWVFVNEFINSLDPKTFKDQFDDYSAKNQKGGAQDDSYQRTGPNTAIKPDKQASLKNINATPSAPPLTPKNSPPTPSAPPLTPKNSTDTATGTQPKNISVSSKAFILYNLLKIKNLIAEFMWFTLIGILVISFSYSHLLSYTCNIAPDTQIKNFNEYNLAKSVKSDKDDIKKDKDDTNNSHNRKYVSH